MNKTPEEKLAERITQNTDFPVLCRKAVKQIGIYYDDFKYWWIWNQEEYKWQETDDTTILNKLDYKNNRICKHNRIKNKTNVIRSIKKRR